MNATLSKPVGRAHAPYKIIRQADADAYWLVTDLVAPLCKAAEYEFLYTEVAPQTGPPVHVHRNEDEVFYIIDGTFALTSGQTKVTATAGCAAYLPRNNPHTFLNVGQTTGRILVAVTPPHFSRFVKNTGDICLDRTRLPQVGPASFERLAAGCARAGIEFLPNHRADQAAALPKPLELKVIGLSINILLRSEQTQGQFSVAEIIPHPGDVVPTHLHRVEDEIFYVLEGEVEFDVAGDNVTGTPGTCIHIPRGINHGFRNVTNRPARMVNYHTPGGFDKFFAACPPAPPSDQAEAAQFIALCKRYGMEVAGT